MNSRSLQFVYLLLALTSYTGSASAAELLVGAASIEITSSEPVAIAGQFELRIARTVETPITANVLALESRQGNQSLDAAVLVSCDVIAIPDDVLRMVREEVHKQAPDLDVKKLFLSATHTHTAPVLVPGDYPVPNSGVMQVEAYREFFVRRIAQVVVQAWNGRRPGSVAWGLSHAVVAYNRRAVYADGSAQMYGRTNVPEFRNLEGYEDHDVGALFFWNRSGKLLGIVVNVSCTAQEVEARTAVNADFWHPVRERLHKRFGADVCVLGWTGAAGDQSPHLMYRQAADDRMARLRGLGRLEEIARRIATAVEDAHEVVRNDQRIDVPLVHRAETLHLPKRLVTEAEYQRAKSASQEAAAQIAKDPHAAAQAHARLQWNQAIVERFERQRSEPRPTYATEVHVIRIGDAAVCTNGFELYTDFGIRIKARSPAVQTFVVQLTGPGSYLPTEKGVRGGHYSAEVQSNHVGPEGGQVLVDRTVEMLQAMWAKTN